MKPQEFANAMWGLQGMNSDCPEVRAVLVALRSAILIDHKTFFVY